MKKSIIAIVIALLLITGFYVYLSYKNNKDLLNGLSNTLPMYGASSYEDYLSKRTDYIKSADDQFINAEITKYGSKEAAFKEVMGFAISYVESKDYETAMKRCNQAWLVDHTNYNAYWCYAIDLGLMGKFDQSIQWFNKTIQSYSKNNDLIANEEASVYRDARKTYTKAVQENPNLAKESFVKELDSSLKSKGY